MSLTDYINKITCFNALDGQKQIPDSSIDMAITSPPYWGLRNYGDNTKTIWGGDPACDHEWGEEKIINRGHPGEKTTLVGTQTANLSKSACDYGASCQKCNAWRGQLGLEFMVDTYIQHLCDIFDETRRVLKDTGSLWVNIGDTYNNNPSNSGNSNLGNAQALEQMGRMNRVQGGIPVKSLCCVPERFVIEMINRGWIKRNTIIWHKSNAMPSSADDRFTVDFEYMYLFTKQPHYYFEQQLESYTEPLKRWGGTTLKSKGTFSNWDNGTGQNTLRDRNMRPNPAGRNKRCVWEETELGIISLKDKHGEEIASANVPLSEIGNYLKTWMGHDALLPSVWNINTKPSAEAHFAVFPSELIETPIKAGCPKEVCNKCGEPRVKKINTSLVNDGERDFIDRGDDNRGRKSRCGDRTDMEISFTQCSCNAGFSAGIVLDMFMGSGTVAIMAKELGMNFIGFDINAEYVNTIAIPRINRIRGMQKTLWVF